MSKPPKETPIIQKPTPVVLDELLIEERDSNESRYDRMLEYGHLHPSRDKYPTYRFLKSEPTEYGGMRYYWANDLSAQDAYNASKTYATEANGFPIFTRSYRVLRTNYLANGPSAKQQPFTGIVTTKITNQGTGYTKDFPVTFTGTGTGAAGIAIVDTANGTVIYIALTNVGSGYTAAPTVVLSAGDGSSAAATAYIQPQTALLVKEDHGKLEESDPFNSLYDRLTMTWETLPGPILSGSHTDELTGIVTNYTKQIVASGSITSGIVGGLVASLSIGNPGSGFTAGTYNLGFSGGGGTGAAGTYTVTAPSPAGKIGSIELTNPGTGFTSTPSAAISGGGGSGATVSVTLLGKPIASLTLISSDATFTDAAALLISDSAGTGVGATGAAALTPTTVASVVVDNGGNGYTAATVAFSGGGGTGAAGTVNLTGNVVTSITMTNNGSGYTSRPIATISGDGTGATVHSVLTNTTVASVTLTASGNLYQSPLVTVTDGTANASVSAAIQPTSIGSITLTAPGSGYSAPTLTFSGGGGGAATGTATLASGTITSVNLTNGGANYTSAPTITTPSGGGTGAVVSAVLSTLTYREVEPLTSCKDMVTTNSVVLSTLPAKKTFPISYRVERGSRQLASLIYATGNNGIDVGLQEVTLNGGSGPAQAYMDEYYMTDSQYAAFSAGPFSITGQSESYTLTATQSGSSARVWTFRTTPITKGTGSGVLDISSSQKPYGIRKVVVVYL